MFNNSDISIKTVKKIIDSFESCLSNKEISNDTTKLLLRVIREVRLRQISMKTMNNKLVESKLEKELNKIKEIENQLRKS